ncbi:hypothetical protein [Endozoicomonas euniceicola]|uniref:Uncharacterized protein n=1 Tax=Endozoicomonas euniceicola TaxID=1234143 RepID=A0ABY6GNH5_9GAMM|nr:hypothetical protein [Endozoicomonas euniceicola]UYM14285.1 hypothetical protein NX720_15410 [Endozoicomonas euniceicola]
MLMNLLAILSALTTPNGTSGQRVRRHKKQSRPCLNKCGKLHIHNNSFCSADCCHEYRARKKEQDNGL